jgi:hypothetical protein
LPHEILLAIARGEPLDGHKPTFAERMDAAKAAAPYYGARLSSVRVEPLKQTGFDLSDLPVNVRDMNKGELLRVLLAGLTADSPAWDRIAKDRLAFDAVIKAINPTYPDE